MKIITYNVNGLRAALSKGFTQWLEEEQPDIVCLQETKAQPDQIPTLEFEALGYKSYFFSAKKKGIAGLQSLLEYNQIMWNMEWEFQFMMMKGVLFGQITETFLS